MHLQMATEEWKMVFLYYKIAENNYFYKWIITCTMIQTEDKLNYLIN